jgi:predicted CXXCH cytochrome family protein
MIPRKHARCPVELLVLLLLVLVVPGCGDRIVTSEPRLFEEPPAAAGNFLGYSSVAQKRTVCGNCHLGKQRAWEGTAHATAWGTMNTVASVPVTCHGCHTVSSLGNVVVEAQVGWVGTGNARYQDVQCESCHGPGLTHVLNPDAPGTKPLAPLAVGSALGRGCGQCHSGPHQPYEEEWSASYHGRVPVGTRATNPSCVGCHDAKNVLQSWGVRSTFLEQEQSGEPMAITCAVCHDPHEKRNPGQLRFPVDAVSPQENLCMKCHQKRGSPEPGSTQGPHSPEGPLLLGIGGWIPPGFTHAPGTLIGSHGPGSNPRLCATCHVNDHQLGSKFGGNFAFRATGHSFQAIPCVDADGKPTGARNCSLADRSFRSCTNGCHSSENAVRSALTVARMRMDGLAATLQVMLAQLPASAFAIEDGKHSTALGARFNMQLVTAKPGSVVHNPFLMEALLIASIRQVQLDYGIGPASNLSLEPQLSAR